MENLWKGTDPNSENQIWSKWDFFISELGRGVSKKEVDYNISRWFLKGFGDVGIYSIKREVFGSCTGWHIKLIIEGAPAHDPNYTSSVRKQFNKFVELGWGNLALGNVKAKILAGNKQEGRPNDQVIILPTVK
jgi:hypothetical protein